jgi:hypothetical protein
MAKKSIYVVIRSNSFQFDGFFFALTKFGYEFEFSPISKHECEMGNGDIGMHLIPIPKLVTNIENYFIAIEIWHVIKTDIEI